MAIDIATQLDKLLGEFRAVRVGPPQVLAGQPVTARVLPPLTATNVTDVIDLGGLLGGATVPGPPRDIDLGQVLANVNFPINLPVRISVQWSVLDQDKKPLATGEFLAPDGLTAAEVSCLFKPAVVELSTRVPTPLRRFLRATVTATVQRLLADDLSRSIALPDIPVFVPPLAIPTILALFGNKDFSPLPVKPEGYLLIAVPDDSPLAALERLSDFFELLNNLDAALRALQPFFNTFTAVLFERLRLLKNALLDFSKPAVIAQSSIPNLNELTVIQRSFLQNDTEASRTISSLIYMSVMRNHVQCANDFDHDGSNGLFRIRITDPVEIVFVKDLNATQPVSIPPNKVEVVTEPSNPVDAPDTFDQRIRSIRLARPFSGGIPSGGTAG